MELNKFINHMSLGVTLGPEDVKLLCNEAKELKFSSVYVNGIYVSLAAKELKESTIRVGTVVGYPFGTSSAEVKLFETKKYIEDGADEISLIINFGMLKSGQIEYIRNEIENIKNIIEKKLLKVVVDLDYLTYEERNILIYICLDLGINNFEILKRKITIEDIKEIDSLTKEDLEIGIVGEIKNLSNMKLFINAGIKSFNTISGVKISKEINENFWS